VPKPARGYEYVIVSAGSVGYVVARRLADGTDATVLLLEAGGSRARVESISDAPRWAENLGSPRDWACRYAPGPRVADRTILAQGKVIGVSGSINGPVWPRGHRADYDAWAEAGNPGRDFPSVLPPMRARMPSMLTLWEAPSVDSALPRYSIMSLSGFDGSRSCPASEV
jgi:choline dehydrogenase